ncbi:MAG: lycopene cyclase domain-containing protein, partial [Bacteroidales bacterium]
GLPLEEWLFFFIIPFACFFIYEVMQYFFPAKTTKLIKVTAFVLSLLFLITAILALHLSYTFVSFILASIVLVIIARWKAISYKLTGFFKGYLVSLLPFFLVNGVLTKMPVVLYNNSENLSVRIFSIPVEDMVYLLSLLFINFTIYEILRQHGERKKAKSSGRN